MTHSRARAARRNERADFPVCATFGRPTLSARWLTLLHEGGAVHRHRSAGKAAPLRSARRVPVDIAAVHVAPNVRPTRRGATYVVVVRGLARYRVHPSRRSPPGRSDCFVCSASKWASEAIRHRAPRSTRASVEMCVASRGCERVSVTERAPSEPSRVVRVPLPQPPRAYRGEHCTKRNRRSRGLHNGDAVHIARSVSAVTCEAARASPGTAGE